MNISYSFFAINPGTNEFSTHNYQYWILLSGSGHFSSNNETFFLTSHDVLEIPFDKTFQIECDNPIQIGLIELTDFTSNNSFFQKKEYSDSELLRKTFFFAMYVRGLHLADGHKINYFIDQLMYEALIRSGLKTYRINPGIAASIEELTRHAFEPDYDINSAVAASGYSQSYFHKLFQETTGVSPLTFIHIQRIDHAKSLLRQDNQLTVKEIAQQCAFSDAYYFSKVFKKHVGMSPSAYSKAAQ